MYRREGWRGYRGSVKTTGDTSGTRDHGGREMPRANQSKSGRKTLTCCARLLGLLCFVGFCMRGGRAVHSSTPKLPSLKGITQAK
ncbi:hypothetical protein PENSPDRAFT_365513 [Peniophora sp. CONT]|nr:hypothetical protein PENSPDRAFT_365513 [Peniophora sp. CONT]